MVDRWDPSPVYIWTCRCGIRLIAGDPVELDWLKGEHADDHIGRGDES